MANGAQLIEGTATGITGFVGSAAAGALDTAVRVRGLVEFEREFGGASLQTPMMLAVRQFFQNGGRNALVVRVAPADGGSGAPITDAQVSGPDLRAEGRGLWALDQADLLNLLCIPPFAWGPGGDIGADTRRAALEYCAARRAFFLADPLAAWQTVDDVRGALDSAEWGLPRSANVALYFPRLRLAGAASAPPLDCVPCGAVAGVYARTDVQRGVWKAPAGVNASLTGVAGLSVRMTDDEQRRLNVEGVNGLRLFPSSGPVVWGSRTLAGADRLASEWKYVPVRRLALHIEESIARGVQWAVFEPNGEPLWTALRRAVERFLHQLFREGAFAGRTEDESYFVKCDSSTMTQADLDEHRVTIHVGVAPLKPAEFVVLTLRQAVAPA